MDHPIRALINGGALAPVAAWLNAASSAERVEAMASLTRGDQAALWALAADAAPLTVDDFVGATHVAVPHRGANTLPLPAFGRRFTKWMVRCDDGTVGGWNDSPLWPWIGPGFFVLRPSVGAELARGGVVVDYHQIPPADLPEGWPRRRPNWLGLQVFIYFHTRDVMRRVTDDVTIGLATKYGWSMRSWFALVREEA